MNENKPFLLNVNIPKYLSTRNCFLEPLSTDHLQLDYEAVMESKNFLRLWSKSTWPDDHFQLEDNLKDLQNHDWEHQNRIAFTYTILNPGKNQCLGCIYINPNLRITAVTENERILLNQKPGNIRFWLRNSIQNTPKENIIIQELISWFVEVWKLETLLFSCNKQIPEQIELFRNNGLKLWLELQESSRHELLWCIK